MDDRPFLVISSDNHVSPDMEDYREYVEAKYLGDLERFLVLFKEYGARTADRRSLESRLDPEDLAEWSELMLESGRWDDFHDQGKRLEEAEREGVAAEVLFPDTGGVPFQFAGPSAAIAMGVAGLKETFDSEELQAAGMRAYNRWLVDFISIAPERFFGQAIVSWQLDVDSAVADLRQAREAGLKGVILPKFSPGRPLFHPDFEPIWKVIEDLEMVVSSHPSLSSTTNQTYTPAGIPHAACAIRVSLPENRFHTRNILSHLIWGGVMERHPKIKFVFSEQGSGWVPGELQSMDYTYRGAYFRTDYHDVIRSKPSEYFQRQCYLGSSLLARVEVADRHSIGIDKMMIGMDLPHHEGMLIHGVRDYLRATLGAEQVPIDEARLMLGQTAAEVFGFDVDRLTPVAERIGLQPDDVLSPPDRDLFTLGDVNKPVAFV